MAIKVPDNISNAPAAFAGVVRRVNFLLKMARLLAGMKGAGSVKVDVSDENIVISATGGGVGLPDGAAVNDTLYWDGEKWVVLAAPSETGTWVLSVTDGVIGWTEAENCDT